MASQLALIEKEVEKKYLSEEIEIETKLRELSLDDTQKDARRNLGKNVEKEDKQIRKKHKDFLKEVDSVIARFRSRTLYSPTDGHLEQAKANYIKQISILRARQSTREVLHRSKERKK